MYKITDTEIKILNIIFEKLLTMKEITLEIGKNMNTVKTLVYRLIKKEFIGCDKSNYPYRYFSNIKKDEILSYKMNSLINIFFDGDIKNSKNM